MYTCPMHPEVRQTASERCPECGMNLVPAQKTKDKNRAPHEKHAGHSTRLFLQKFWVSLLLTVPVVLYSDIALRLFSWTLPEFFGSAYVPLVFGSAVFFYGGWVFLVGAWRELYGRMPGMMTLIAIAVMAAYWWSVYAVFAGVEPLFWELTTLITIMLLGHWIEMRAVGSAQGALKALSTLLPDTAEVLRGKETKIVPLSELKEGDIVFVRPGAKIPADGTVVSGDSNVDESMVTGESKPVSKKEGDATIAGTINGDGALKIQVTSIGEQTFLAGVMRLVAQAQASKSRLQVFSDRAAFSLTLIAVGGGVITFTAWLVSGAGISFATARLVAVLVVACPHALGLAVPLVAAISTTKAARNGFLVKQRLALEAARTIDTVLFDKTGTLTAGTFGVVAVEAVGQYEAATVLGRAAAVNALSEHPIARAIVAKAKENGLALPESEKFEALKGRGATALVAGKRVMVGGSALLESVGATVPATLQQQAAAAGTKGHTVVFVLEDGAPIGSIALADSIRRESREAVQALKRAGIQTMLVTGDSEAAAVWVSGELGIDDYFARVLPQQKSEKVKILQEKGRRVAMVGDGINDAPALAQADLGVAVGAGTNVAIESAGIVLVRNDPRDIGKIISLSRMTYAKMIQNLFWATGYNIIALPLAAGVLAAKGIILQPAAAAVLMSASTVIVAVNALLLRRKRL